MTKPILFVDHALALGGAETSLLSLMQQLESARHQPVLACGGSAVAEAARGAKIPVVEMPFPRLRRNPRSLVDLWRGARRLAKLAQSRRVGLVHGNTVRASFYGALAAKMAGLPFVWHIRDFWLSESKPRWTWADRWVKRALLALSKVVIANSEAVAAQLPASPKLRVVHNGLNLEAYRNFSPAGRKFRADYAIPPEAPLVGIAGRLRPWKGQVDFLQAMALLKDSIAEAWIIVIGGAIFDDDDAYPARLQQLARDLGIAQRTCFTGHLDDPRPAYAALDVLVHCGRPEPFGLVNIEAMALARPVVAYAHGALPEIVVDGQTGLLVRPYDQAALAQAVAGLLNDEALRHRMGEAAQRRVAERFTIQRVAAEVMAVYDEVLGAPADGVRAAAGERAGR
ncbi:MAG: glycosyltransferase family 4 protein [Anaerolineae bacterium]